MELVLVLVVLLIVFGLGPLLAMLDFLTMELGRGEGSGVGIGRLLASLLLLWIPFAWVVYFVLIRRRPPFA
jgi:uncharacterized BrkB/YihY/UPF0761 family membrane protein